MSLTTQNRVRAPGSAIGHWLLPIRRTQGLEFIERFIGHFLFLTLAFSPLAHAEKPSSGAVTIQGSAPLEKLLSAAVRALSAEGITVKASAEGGSSDAISALGSGAVDLACMLRRLTPEERATYPDKAFEEFQLGTQIVALIVPEILWNNGVRAVTREQAEGIYEGRITNWSQLGGPNRSLKFYNPARGHGIWELFATWLYGDQAKAAAGRFETVSSGEDAHAAVQFNSGAISVAYLQWADRKDVFPLAIKDEHRLAYEPNSENVAAGKYPLFRPVYIAAGGKPVGPRRKIIEFLLGPAGLEILKANDISPVANSSGKESSRK